MSAWVQSMWIFQGKKFFNPLLDESSLKIARIKYDVVNGAVRSLLPQITSNKNS